MKKNDNLNSSRVGLTEYLKEQVKSVSTNDVSKIVGTVGVITLGASWIPVAGAENIKMDSGSIAQARKEALEQGGGGCGII